MKFKELILSSYRQAHKGVKWFNKQRNENIKLFFSLSIFYGIGVPIVVYGLASLASEKSDIKTTKETTKPKRNFDELTNIQLGQACKYYIANEFSKNPRIVSTSYITKDAGGHFIKAWYTRDSDNTQWEYVCHLMDNTIVWAALDNGNLGRWRYEDEAKFEFRGDKLSIY